LKDAGIQKDKKENPRQKNGVQDGNVDLWLNTKKRLENNPRGILESALLTDIQRACIFFLRK
jgi:hypothetical protein